MVKIKNLVDKYVKNYLPLRRGKLRTWLILIGIILIKVNPQIFIIGIGVLTVGAILQLWAKANLLQNRILATTGPYRLVRHPFYLANALIDIGICLMINRIEITLIYFVLWFYIYLRTIRREEKILEKLFGEEFRQYKQKTPSLIPYNFFTKNFWRGLSEFSWQNPNISQGKTIPRLIRYISLPLLFFSVWKLREEGLAYFTDWQSIEFLCLLGFIFLAYLAYRLQIILQNRKG